MFGEVVLADQMAGPGSAEVAGYPDHDVGRASYTIAADTESRVELELERLPPLPGLPPLRGQIAGAHGRRALSDCVVTRFRAPRPSAHDAWMTRPCPLGSRLP